MQTEPPPSATFSETVNQWVIYDAYVDYEYKKEMQDEQDLKGRRATDKQTKKRLLGDTNKDDGHEISQKVVRAAKVLERMVNQNIYIDIALGILWYNIQIDTQIKIPISYIFYRCFLHFKDFRYWEDASDEFRDNEGTLLPLWKFSFDKAKKLEITGLCWNPAYNDLFAASYGSCN